MQEVILHIGVHKTGTSSIQNALHRFDDGGTFYAQLGNNNHSIAMRTIFSSDYRNYHIWKLQGITDQEIDNLRNKFLEALKAQISRKDRRRLVVCAEDVCILKEDEKKKLVEFFTASGVILKIVCYVRNPARLAASSFQERVKAGNNETLLEPYPSFGEILEPFEKLIHKNDILVRYFSRENMEEQCVVKDFCSLLNIEIDKVVDLNESMPTSALKLLFNFNKLPLPIDGDKRIFEARQKMIEALSYAYRHEEKIDSQYFLDTVIDSQYAFLEKHFGITLKPDRATNDLKSLEDFMLDQNDIDLSYLDNLLDKLNVNSSFFQSIESKMIMLFFGTLGQWYQ